jgi:hypothetical protein
MTRKLTISLPDDVATDLDNVGNVSAYVAEALRSYRRGRQVRDLLARQGVVVTDEGVARMRKRLQEMDLRRATTGGVDSAA